MILCQKIQANHDIFGERAMSNISHLLSKAVDELNQGDVDLAINTIAEARRTLIQSFSLTRSTENNYEVLQKVFHLTKCLMLYFKALGLKEKKLENEPLCLTYLSQALGINTMLDNALLPLMRRTSESQNDRNDVIQLTKQNRSFGDSISTLISDLVDTFKSRIEGSIKEDLDDSIQKIVNAINPKNQTVRKLAVELSARFQAGDFKQARKIYEFVRDEIQYIHDPLTFEDIQNPETTLKLRAGDCEDQAILLSSLLSAIGFKSALIFTDSDNDGVADHVYSAVYIPTAPDYSKPFTHKELEGDQDMNDWIPLDPTSQDSDFGIIPIGDFQIVKFIRNIKVR